MTYEGLMEEVMTTHEASEYAKRIQAAAQSLYQTDESPLETLARNLAPQEYHRFSSYLQHHSINASDPKEIHRILQELHAHILQIPKMSLTIAFPPTQAFARDIADWLSMHDTPPLQIAFAVDPDIVAGAVINFKGKTHDHSLASKLEAALKQR